jgi:YD repeat-containing protein
MPFVGISTRNEPNNQVSYFEYDGAGRLERIRNADRNIIKQFQYTYKDQINPCTNSASNWVYTGVLRCVKTSDHTNNNTGVEEKQERDMNNCSSTYLQYRWVSLGVTGNCPVVSNCSGPDKRVVNGVCQTGQKLLVESYQTGPGAWLCTYKYVWTDGFSGPTFTESSSTGCGGGEID